MTCGIYLITNKLNGMQYVGQSINIENRFKQHCYGRTNNSRIDKAIKEFGVDNFVFEIICECNENMLDVEEKKFINLYASFRQGYNLTSGGQGGRLHQLAKEKISKSKTTSGYFNVNKKSDDSTFMGFIWVYKWTDEQGNINQFSNVDLNKLEEQVTQKGLLWKVINKNKALESQKENDIYLTYCEKGTNTGFLGVSKVSHNRVKQGFIYQYNTPYNPNGINSSFGSVSFERLKDKVLNKGLPWGIVDKNKAMECGLL